MMFMKKNLALATLMNPKTVIQSSSTLMDREECTEDSRAVKDKNVIGRGGEPSNDYYQLKEYGNSDQKEIVCFSSFL